MFLRRSGLGVWHRELGIPTQPNGIVAHGVACFGNINSFTTCRSHRGLAFCAACFSTLQTTLLPSDSLGRHRPRRPWYKPVLQPDDYGCYVIYDVSVLVPAIQGCKSELVRRVLIASISKSVKDGSGIVLLHELPDAVAANQEILVGLLQRYLRDVRLGHYAGVPALDVSKASAHVQPWAALPDLVDAMLAPIEMHMSSVAPDPLQLCRHVRLVVRGEVFCLQPLLSD
mmetsp:Transcript_137066/g.292737  ORF Transcript_137066/g.292737 Transcript_137066/m.292737 type:complete len:228 (+) Transcript_137066:233-916(+)